MKIKYILFTSALLFLVSCSTFKRAEKKFEKGEFDSAIDLYQQALKKNDNAAQALFSIAESYRLSNRLEIAEPYYKASIDSGYTEDEVFYNYSLSLKANSNYDKAREVLESYLLDANNPEIKKLAEFQLKNLYNIDEILEDQTFYTVKNLEEINTPAAEYAPFFHDNELYFTSTRDDDGKVYKATGDNFSDIYKVKSRGANVDTATIEKLPPIINWSDANEGSVAIDSRGRTMVFARGNTGKRKGLNDVNLYITRYRNGKWSEPELMKINDPEAWNSTPAFSEDGRTLYFSSTREGGFGGVDLYSATVNSRGQWGNVRNLGNKINTPEDEMFPSASQDGKLYFSSNGHPGLGKLDIFVAERKGGKITISHLGKPMNSNKDDFAVFMYSPDRGFFSSDRPGGEGRDDIYTFKNEDPNLKIVNYFLAGVTTTHNANEEEVILPGANVRLFSQDSVLLGEILTGQDGEFNFRVSEEEDYFIIAEKDNYFTTRKTFSTVGKTVDKSQLTSLITNKVFETEILLEEIILDKAFELENIYYDFDSANIRADAAIELDKLVTILKDNPPIKIELSSHTDARGEAAYNQELSKRRAESAVAYIISQGIDPSRIKARGYGESQLIIEDAQTEEEHETNRRTEFKVTEYDKEIARRIREQEEAQFKKGTVEVEIKDEKEVPEASTDEFDFN
ncbi:cell envelope biogenesis protein OmpA [Marivirga tractuosa]|uniref:OmpA/MotB domain protein n=1 Tax=Marivirga tractuosa (strain ATCC 23168 / DSM 4126 / NBRC 15989 / NCIMB 1408 / VKM B-1430 / H-43) TaxID=643867 RepID=E4TL19_MARTH|nr:OmpA family protein [Marivirga tractuosa]ADR23296.1 OmpA/MotB domain protein [Marivirga tractuosa DSM 4126]BDD16030.1 cell envelope biogenesis protein OmpA [Marivirga tractuosa]